MAVIDFYLWYQDLELKQEHIKCLLENVGYSSGVNYDYRGGKTNKIYSIVEDEAERMEKLKASYSRINSIRYIVSEAMYSLILINPLGYRAIKTKLEKVDKNKVKSKKETKSFFTKKQYMEAEQQALEYIREYLKKNGVNYYM